VTTRLRIALHLPLLGTLDPRKPVFVQGDEQVARSWQKYLLRRDDVEDVRLYGAKVEADRRAHVAIHFNPFLDLAPGIKNILYLQNAFPREIHAGGTVGVFKSVSSRFEGYLFTSDRLKSACADGAVIPFATDPEVFYPQKDHRYDHPVCFVGNDIRGPRVNYRYLLPALPFGLVMYGLNAWAPPLNAACRGKLPDEDLPRLYSSARINLNAHIEEHIRNDTINLRIYDALACGGLVISDEVPSLPAIFDDAVVCTEGGDDLWAKLVHYLADEAERARRAAAGRRIVLSGHTYVQRADTLMRYLRESI
jgi:spore maturation protein CgeB